YRRQSIQLARYATFSQTSGKPKRPMPTEVFETSKLNSLNAATHAGSRTMYASSDRRKSRVGSSFRSSISSRRIIAANQPEKRVFEIRPLVLRIGMKHVGDWPARQERSPLHDR